MFIIKYWKQHRYNTFFLLLSIEKFFIYGYIYLKNKAIKKKITYTTIYTFNEVKMMIHFLTLIKVIKKIKISFRYFLKSYC